MKTLALIAALTGLTASLCSAQYDPRFPSANAEADQISTTVVHKDGTYTTTERDTANRRLVRQTMRKNGTVVMRSVFRLDENDRERKGQVYDGQGNVLFISEFIYDGLGKVQEERVYSATGQPVRRLIYQTDRLGNRKPFCMTYTDGRPIGQLMELDDDTPYSTTSTHAHAAAVAAASRAGTGEVTRSGGNARVDMGGSLGWNGGGGTAAPARTAAPAPAAAPAPEKPRRRGLRIFRRR